MTLPRYPHVDFNRPPLRLVLAQIRFPVLFRFGEKPFLAPFQEAMQPEYPRPTQEQQVVLKFSANGFENAGEMFWRFSSRDGNWSAILGEAALTLECRGQYSFAPFIQRFEQLLSLGVKHLGLRERARVGIRFVNEARSEGATTLGHWGALLNPKFVGFAGGDVLEGTVEHALQELRWKRSDGQLVLKHGLLQGTTVVSRPGEPAPQQGACYLLDFDYSEEADGALEIDGTVQQLRAYHDVIYGMFRWALDKGALYPTLEPRDDTAKR